MVNHVVVWCGVASYTHLIYGASWLRELQRREPGEVRVELMNPRLFFGAHTMSPDQVAELLPEGIEVTLFQPRPAPREASLRLLSVGAVGTKPWLELHRLNPLRRIPVIVTDEGIGSYGNWTSRHQAYRRQGGTEPASAIRASVVEGATALLTTSRWPLHLQRRDGWGLNTPVADEFRRRAPEPHRGRRVVFLGQPWPEIGVMDEPAYTAHVQALARGAADAGYEFRVVPHPGEDPARYSEELTSPGMAELNPDVLGASLVIGASSTALLNVAALYGVPAWRVGTPELFALDEQLAPRQASVMAYYTPACVSAEEFGRRLTRSFEEGGMWAG